MLSAEKIHDYYVKSKLEPQVELDAALGNIVSVTSFRYSLQSQFTVNDREEVISRVEGEKSNGNTHIKGEMVNTPVDIYYIDRTIYNYDSFSDKWLVIESDTTNSEELLISELNPLSNFRFKSIKNIEKLGFEIVDGTDCLMVSCRPSIESQLLGTLWQDFSYELWIDYEAKLIKKAVLSANNKQSPGTRLNLKVQFSDFNKNIKIEPPDTAKTKEN
ncbi:MAG: hypothetical protein PHR65_06645 [Syntrophomonadaceae bacterium]|nr:hypothetical protein [Syntrophomonadaceae bacterium]